MHVETITTADESLLRGVRSTLADADEALLAVAFVQVAGVNLLAKQLKRLASSTRLLVTSTFGMSNPEALALAHELAATIKVHNPSGGTYHPKIYIGRRGDDATAIVGSANLTGGLVSNVEAAVMMRGTLDDAPIRAAWDFAESMWNHAKSAPWSPVSGAPIADEEFTPELLALIAEAVARTGGVFPTVAQGKVNRVTALSATGVYVVTEASTAKGSPPQLVPAWMLEIAWQYLATHGELTNRYLLADDGLNVKRSSAVCALLAALPGVVATYTASDGVVLALGPD